MDRPALPPPAIILVEPQLAENIGTAARAMANFALPELRLVNPRADAWPSDKAVAAASGAPIVLDNPACFEDVPAAIADLSYVLATTARPRDMVKAVLTPEQAARELVARIRDGQRCGILFGRERSGLENDEIALADAIVMAPVNPAFASINLAQAVLLIGYEWYKTATDQPLGRGTGFEVSSEPGLQTRSSRPATKDELMGFFGHLEAELDDSGFLRPPEKRETMVRNIRNMFGRMEATEQEVRTLRGIVASLTYTHKRRWQKP